MRHNGSNGAYSSDVPTADEVHRQLQRIIASNDFVASDRNCADPFTREMEFSAGQAHVLDDITTISSTLLPRVPWRVDLSAALLFEGSSLPIQKWER